MDLRRGELIDGHVTQFEMKMAQNSGLVKFDPGFKPLTVIQKAVDLIRVKLNPNFDINLIPLDDPKVFHDIGAGHNLGVYLLESSGMCILVAKVKPSCFEDMIALVALFRPGPLSAGIVDDFIERKHGRAPINYPVPQLEKILKETYGIILYHEQVMKIAGELASYSLGETDLLRRAIGKKIRSEMKKQKKRFVTRAVSNGHDETKAMKIFDLMAEFANYSSNKSRSAAYGLVSYQTAFLKTHYPAEYMAAIMTCDHAKTSKIVRYVDECRHLHIKVLPPNINQSFLQFTVPEPQKICFGLSAIKGIGPQSLEPLVQNRLCNGPFYYLSDLAKRLDLHKIGKNTLELLTMAGALDDFGISRSKLFSVLDDVVKFSGFYHQAKNKGQRGILNVEDENTDDINQCDSQHDGFHSLAKICSFIGNLTPLDLTPGASTSDWLRKEKSLLGVYLTGHPMNFHREDRRAFASIGGIKDLHKIDEKKSITLVAVLAAVNERLTNKNIRMAKVRLEDEKSAIEAFCFEPDIPRNFHDLDTVVMVQGVVSPPFVRGGHQRESGGAASHGGGSHGSENKEPVCFRIEKIIPIEELRLERDLGVNSHHPFYTIRIVEPYKSMALRKQRQSQGDKANV